MDHLEEETGSLSLAEKSVSTSKHKGSNSISIDVIFSRLIGLGTLEATEEETTAKPCVGLCHVEKKEKMSEDKQHVKIKESRKQDGRCVGLCYIMRKNGMEIDQNLQKLRKERPCVGLCYLLKKKKEELLNMTE